MPACLECEYEKDENNQETENIKCKACNYYQALSSDGKCYDCKFDVSDGCQECKFIKNEIDNSEKLMCTACNTGYFLNSNGKCISYLPYLKKIPYCYFYSFRIENNTLRYYNDDDYIYYYYRSSYNQTKEINTEINTECIECETGYFRNDEGLCEPLTPEKCSLISIMENYPIKYYECRNYCGQEKNSYIDLVISNINSTFDIENNDNDEGSESNSTIRINMYEEFERYFYYSNDQFSILYDDLKSLIVRSQLCISNSGNGGKNHQKI